MKKPKNPSKYVGIDVYLCGEKATITNIVEEFMMLYVHNSGRVIVKYQEEAWPLIRLPGLAERLTSRIKKITTSWQK